MSFSLELHSTMNEAELQGEYRETDSEINQENQLLEEQEQQQNQPEQLNVINEAKNELEVEIKKETTIYDYMMVKDYQDELEKEDNSDAREYEELRIINSTLSNFEKLPILYQGHFGVVYKARYKGNCVAVKTIESEDYETLQNEISIMRKARGLEHVINLIGNVL